MSAGIVGVSLRGRLADVQGAPSSVHFLSKLHKLAFHQTAHLEQAWMVGVEVRIGPHQGAELGLGEGAQLGLRR
jgi:hypothetical protein